MSATRPPSQAPTKRARSTPTDEQGGRDGRQDPGHTGQVGSGGSTELVPDRDDGAHARRIDRVRTVCRAHRVTEAPHRPVMVEEVVELLAGADVVVDMT